MSNTDMQLIFALLQLATIFWPVIIGVCAAVFLAIGLTHVR